MSYMPSIIPPQIFRTRIQNPKTSFEITNIPVPLNQVAMDVIDGEVLLFDHMRQNPDSLVFLFNDEYFIATRNTILQMISDYTLEDKNDNSIVYECIEFDTLRSENLVTQGPLVKLASLGLPTNRAYIPINELRMVLEDKRQYLYQIINTEENVKSVVSYQILYNLTKFYIDPKKYCFPIQILVLKTMLELLVKTIDNNPNCKLIICERSILSSRHVFTKMLYESSILTEIEYKIYESLFDEWVNSKEFTPQKIVYLNISPEISYKRILKRSRVGENIISLDYIISCGLYHHYWLYSIADSVEILTIECDNDVTYNLEDNQNEGCQWIQQIVQFANAF